MKNSIKLIISVIISLCYSNLLAEEDQFIRLTDMVKVSKESDQWLKVVIPFEIVNHPLKQKYEALRTPTTKDQVINLNFLDNLKFVYPYALVMIYKKINYVDPIYLKQNFINTIVLK